MGSLKSEPLSRRGLRPSSLCQSAQQGRLFVGLLSGLIKNPVVITIGWFNKILFAGAYTSLFFTFKGRGRAEHGPPKWVSGTKKPGARLHKGKDRSCFRKCFSLRHQVPIRKKNVSAPERRFVDTQIIQKGKSQQCAAFGSSAFRALCRFRTLSLAVGGMFFRRENYGCELLRGRGWFERKTKERLSPILRAPLFCTHIQGF